MTPEQCIEYQDAMRRSPNWRDAAAIFIQGTDYRKVLPTEADRLEHMHRLIDGGHKPLGLVSVIEDNPSDPNRGTVILTHLFPANEYDAAMQGRMASIKGDLEKSHGIAQPASLQTAQPLETPERYLAYAEGVSRRVHDCDPSGLQRPYDNTFLMLSGIVEVDGRRKRRYLFLAMNEADCLQAIRGAMSTGVTPVGTVGTFHFGEDESQFLAYLLPEHEGNGMMEAVLREGTQALIASARVPATVQ